MAGSDELVQRAVHALETGAAYLWIRRALAGVALAAIALLFMYNFRGLATSQAMDQAQIGRLMLRGHLWHTNYARPRAIGQLQAHGKDVARRLWVDTYNAPLPSFVDAIALLPIKSRLQNIGKDPIYIGDRAIAAMAILLFFGSVFIQFLTARRLFDRWLAVVACGLILLCDMMWQYATSGLPQMLLLFLFNATIYVLVRAIEAKYRGGAVGPWLAAIGVGFGLLALSHGLTIWLFVPALIFIAFFFRPRGWAAALVLGVFLILYAPWLLRNWIVCGNPAGLALYSALDGIGHSETGWMQQVVFTPEGVGPAAVRDKMLNNLIVQTGKIFQYLGWSAVALAFFASFLHFFKKSETSITRWMLLSMWAGGVMGMAVFGMNEEQAFSPNQLHLLFVPLMTCYGLAWLLVQWNRLGIKTSARSPCFHRPALSGLRISHGQLALRHAARAAAPRFAGLHISPATLPFSTSGWGLMKLPLPTFRGPSPGMPTARAARSRNSQHHGQPQRLRNDGPPRRCNLSDAGERGRQQTTRHHERRLQRLGTA